MKKFLRILAVVLAASLTVVVATSGRRSNQLRLLYWNIQNGMWDGQPDNYDRFVDWVKAQKPDVCVWCEAATIYIDGTADKKKGDKYLPAHWEELARRYGHKYVFRGGWRDNYPQVITSRYPIEGVARIIQNAKKPVMTIKPFAAGRTTPFVGLNFNWNVIRDCDMITVGVSSAAEAKEDIEISYAALEHRFPDLAARSSPVKQTVLGHK